MLDFIKEETSQKTMTANVILTFDTLINEFGTQEIFDVEFAIADTGDETVFNMLSAINLYLAVHKLPKTKLWKISAAANWTKIANDHGLNIQIIDETNGKWQFLSKDHMSHIEQHLQSQFGFGIDISGIKRLKKYCFVVDDVFEGKRVFYDAIIEAQSYEEAWTISEDIIRSIYGEYLDFDVFKCDEKGNF
jgi:hypothetical protein